MSDLEFSGADRTAIRDLIEVTRRAWAAGDGAAYASVCAEDARYVTASGRRLVGREQIARGHQHVFDTVLRGSQLDLEEPVDFQPIGDHAVVVHAIGSVLFPQGETPVRVKGMLTMVAVRHGDDWRIASFSNTPIEESSPDSGN